MIKMMKTFLQKYKINGNLEIGISETLDIY